MDVESELRVCGIMLCLLFAGYDIGTHWEWGTDLELGVFFLFFLSFYPASEPDGILLSCFSLFSYPFRQRQAEAEAERGSSKDSPQTF